MQPFPTLYFTMNYRVLALPEEELLLPDELRVEVPEELLVLLGAALRVVVVPEELCVALRVVPEELLVVSFCVARAGAADELRVLLGVASREV